MDRFIDNNVTDVNVNTLSSIFNFEGRLNIKYYFINDDIEITETFTILPIGNLESPISIELCNVETNETMILKPSNSFYKYHKTLSNGDSREYELVWNETLIKEYQNQNVW